MANPTLLTSPFCVAGEKNDIPAMQPAQGDGRFNQYTGFPSETSIPTINGGKNVSRQDMNGAFYFLSNILFQVQKGKVFEWDAGQTYSTPAIVMDTGVLYFCKQDVAVGGVRPINDSSFTYWARLADYLYDLMTIKYSDIIGAPTKLSQFSNVETDFQSGAQVTATVNASATTINNRIDGEVSTLNTTISNNYSTLDGKIDTKTSALNTKIENNYTTLDTKIDNNYSTLDGKIDTKTGELSTRITTEVATLTTAVNTLDTKVDTEVGAINDKIPEQASATNQLADKAFVNSTVQTNTANFRGPWTTWADVPSNASSYPADAYGKKTPTSNDYIAVINASDYPVPEGTAQLKGTWRFKYTGVWDTNKKNGWLPEYQINREPLTEAQIAALNSGITANGVAQITTNQTNIATNTANIATNTSDIATHTTQITQNTTDIATNASAIAQHTTDIATNATNIATNTANIATNTGNIATNTTNITANTNAIATNANNIATNTADIAELKTVKESLKPVATVGTYESLLTHYVLPPATQATLGGVKQGGGVVIESDGTIKMDTSSIINAIDWTQLNTSEKLYNNGSSGVINLSNGRVQITTATTITMPKPLQNCATWVTLWCNSGAVTFDTSLAPVYFEDGNDAPTGDGVFVYTLASIGGSVWYCLFTGMYRTA